MRYPWRYWVLYAVGVLAVGTALAALTHFALKIERAEALAQRRAELEDRVSQALWRIDSEILAPIVAEQATLPAFFYEPIQPLPPTPNGKGSVVATFPRDYVVSPLLTEPSEFTLSRGTFSKTSVRGGGGSTWDAFNANDGDDLLGEPSPDALY